jgi:hypothetical protein
MPPTEHCCIHFVGGDYVVAPFPVKEIVDDLMRAIEAGDTVTHYLPDDEDAFAYQTQHVTHVTSVTADSMHDPLEAGEAPA